MTKKREQLLNKYMDDEKWLKARELLIKELEKEPDDHWLLTNLAMTYYEEREYKSALRIVKKAFTIKPNCPLVRWDYASILDLAKSKKEAIEMWKTLIKEGVESIAYNECGEGIQWARALLNDSRYRIGLTYNDLSRKEEAIKYIKEHISHRNPNCKSIYNLRRVKKDLNKILNGDTK